MIEKLAGALLAVFFLSGRFSVVGKDAAEDTMLYDVRLWTLLALVGVAVTYSRPRSNILRYTNHFNAPLVITIALLLPFYVALSSLWSISFDLATKKMLEAVILAVACTCMLPFFNADRLSLVRHWFWVWVVLTTGLMCLIAGASMDSTRMSILGGGPNIFGRNMGLLFLGALYLHRRNSAMTAWRWYPVMVVALLMVLLSGSRGALLATSVGGFIYLLIDNHYRTRNVLAIGCFLILTQVAMLTTEMGERAYEMFETRILNQTFERQYMSRRDELFADAYELGLERPWFGQGLSGFTIAAGDIYPHNIALELFCETGIVGVSLLVILLLAVLRFAVRHRRQCDPATWAAFGLAVSAAMFSGDFFDSRGIFLFAILGSQEIAALRPQSLAQVRAPGIARIKPRSYSPAPSPRI
jgi:O-antigen ligase